MRYGADEFEASKFLGNAVGRKNPFMRKIACMGPQEREIAGYLEAMNQLLKISPKQPTKEQRKQLDTLFTVIQVIGQSKFSMDIISHLSMKTEEEVKIADAH
jgi:hypothetical protein